MCFVFVSLFYVMSPFSEKDNLGLISNFFIEQKYFHNKLQKADSFYGQVENSEMSEISENYLRVIHLRVFVLALYA